MPADAGLTNSSSFRTDKVTRKLSWQYPIWLVAMGFVLIGISTVVLLLLPQQPGVSGVLTALVFIGVSRFGSQPSRPSPPQTAWIGGEAYSYFGLRQSVLNGSGFFVSMTVVLTWFRGKLPGVFGISVALLGGLLFGAFGVDLQAKELPAGREAARVGIVDKLRNLVTARFLLKFIILSSIFEIVGLWEQPFRVDVLLFALIAGLVVAGLSHFSELEDDAARISNA